MEVKLGIFFPSSINYLKYLCYSTLPGLSFFLTLPPEFEEDLRFFAPALDSPSPAPGVGKRSLSREEILVKLFSLTSGEGMSGVAEREPPGVSFWTLLPLMVFFLLALEALLPRRTCPI